MKYLISILTSLAVIAAGFFAVTQSLITSAPIIGLCSLLGLVSLLNISQWNQRFTRVRLIRIQLYLVTLLFTFLLIRAMFSPVIEYLKQDIFLIVSFSIIYLVSTLCLNTLRAQKFLVVTIVLLFLANLSMFHPSLNEWRDTVWGYAKGTDVSGLYNHRNVFSNIMMLGVLTFVSIGLFGQGKIISKLIFLILSLAGLTVIVASESRGGMVSVGVGSITVFAIWVRLNLSFSSLKVKLASASILVLVIGGAVFAYKVVDNKRFENHVGILNRDGGRPEMFSMAIDQFGDGPIVGSGSRSFQYKSYEYWSSGKTDASQDYIFVHNEFLQMLTDYGIVGFLLLLALVFISIVMSVKVTENTDRSIVVDGWLSTRALKVASIGTLAGMITHSLFSFPLHSLSNLIVFGITSSWLFMQFSENSQDSKTRMIFYKLPLACYILAASICGLYFSIPEIKASMVFWKNGIKIDDQNWDPNLVDSVSWTTALEEVAEIAPNHNRYTRLASLYLLEKVDAAPASAVVYSDRAFASYKKALEYNPFDSVAMLNIADYHLERNEFIDTERWLKKVKKININREKIFKIYYREALLYIRWARYLEQQNQLDLALQKLSLAQKAINQNIKEVGIIENLPGKIVFAALILAKSDLLRSKGDLQAANESFDEYDTFALKNLNSWHDQTEGKKRILVLFNEAKLLQMRDLRRELDLLTKCAFEIAIYKRRFSSRFSDSEQRSIKVIAQMCNDRIMELKEALRE